MEERFYISFERSGGFAGIVNSVEIDGDTISLDEKKKLIKLIEDAGFFELDIEGINSSNAPDRFSYKMMIEIDEEKKSLNITESAVPEDLRPLIDYLSRKARQQK